MGYSAIQKALQNMVAANTTLTVIWADQQVPAQLTDYITMKLVGDHALGSGDEQVIAYDGTKPNGSESTTTATGWREATLSIQAFQTGGEEVGDSSPRAALASIRSAFAQFANIQVLASAGVSVFDLGSIQDVSVPAGTIFEPRGLLEVRVYFAEAPASAVETTGYITQVDGGDLIDNGTFTPG